jgi:sirohydrochlorin ferrochelatase
MRRLGARSSASAALPHHRRARSLAAASSSSTASQQQQQPTVGVVIVDHGSRAKASNDMLLEFVELYRVTAGAHTLVEPAHMELAEPSISDAVGECALS